MSITIEQARQAKEEILKRLNECPELAGVGISPIADGYAVSIHLFKPLPDDVIVPKEEHDVPIHIEFVGKITAF
jgi:hypothetical protein